MGLNDPFSQFPLSVRVESEGVLREYVRESGYFAVHGPVPPDLTMAVLYSFDDPVINVCRGEDSAVASLPSDLPVTPVYRLGPHGTQGVPSGRVFIRFRPQVHVERRRKELTACGFSVHETLSYAPYSAWVQSMDGNIATALHQFAKLRTIPDIVLAEPQMLMRRGQR